MSKYQLTIGEFSDFLKETEYTTDFEKKKGGIFWLAENGKEKYYFDSLKSWKNIGYSPIDSLPLTYVNWNNAIVNCNWKSK
jgi:formylglycine-generating enzyme required for sulfatase activity